MSRRRAVINLKTANSRAALTITHPNAAGVDIGSASHYVAVPPDRDDAPVREFPGFTVDLNAIADWLTTELEKTVILRDVALPRDLSAKTRGLQPCLERYGSRRGT